MSSLLNHYEDFLLSNASTVSTVESSLRSLTWFLPGRFKDAELASETLTAVLNLTSLYHDSILSRIIKSNPKFKPLIPPSVHTRYTRAWADKDSRYKWIARSLEIIKFIELLVEMGLRRKLSNKNRWNGIVLLETVKALLRLFLLKITRRPLLSPPLPEREFDPATVSSTSASAASSPTLAPSSQNGSPIMTPEHLKNNHISLDYNSEYPVPPPPLTSEAPVEDYLLPKALSVSAIQSPITLLRPLTSPIEWLSELIYVFRPLIYASAISLDPKSPNPIVYSLALDLLSRYLRRIPPGSANLERSEYARRDRDFVWYLLRGPIWLSYTRPKLESLANVTARTPVLGLVSAFVRDWMPLIDEYYYYTST